MNWDIVTSFKSQGGLGIRGACLINIALLGKLGWDITKKANKLWVRS